MDDAPQPKLSRIQQRNRTRIMDAALEVFSRNGFRGATLDLIASEAGLSKPNLLYYFDSKEAVHIDVLNRLMETWLTPLEDLDPCGEPKDELLRYVERKLEMAFEYPRESRLFANEILQGAPRMAPHLETHLKPLFDDKVALIQSWIDAERLPPLDPRHFILSVWATTQHYADFEAQTSVLFGAEDIRTSAWSHLKVMFSRLLSGEVS